MKEVRKLLCATKKPQNIKLVVQIWGTWRGQCIWIFIGHYQKYARHQFHATHYQVSYKHTKQKYQVSQIFCHSMGTWDFSTHLLLLALYVIVPYYTSAARPHTYISFGCIWFFLIDADAVTPIAVTPGVSHIGAYHSPSDGHFEHVVKKYEWLSYLTKKCEIQLYVVSSWASNQFAIWMSSESDGFFWNQMLNRLAISTVSIKICKVDTRVCIWIYAYTQIQIYLYINTHMDTQTHISEFFQGGFLGP